MAGKRMACKFVALFLGTVLFTLGSTSAFCPHAGQVPSRIRRVGASPTASSRSRRLPCGTAPAARRDPTVLYSAKVVPIAYASMTGSLLFHAVQASTPRIDTAVLAATAALAAFNLAPTDAARLASSKRACARTPPAASSRAKQRRQAALTWRSVVRFKLFGQMLGLVFMAMAATNRNSRGIGRGAALIMATNTLFVAGGGAIARHDDQGVLAPMASGAATSILTIDTVLMAAVLVAASPVPSWRRGVAAGIYTVGASIGALEGLVTLLADTFGKSS